MLRKLNMALLVAVWLSIIALPVLAAQDGEGGIHFGPYTLSADERASGDLVVFGPVTLEKDSEFDGDLAAFGGVTLEKDALITGDLAAFGAANIAGIVEGNIFTAGSILLQESAVIDGDISTVGSISREEGATINGETTTFGEEGAFNWQFPGVAPVVIEPPAGPALFVRVLWQMVRGMLTIVVLALFALLIASVWPREMGRVGQTIMNAPLPSFGVGVLALLIALVLFLLLLLTICLSPLVAIVVGVGIAFGWVALGAVLGERILVGLFKAKAVTPVSTALLGTVTLTLLAVLVNMVSGCLYAILILPFFALVAGAVTLTRFGAMPYAARGTGRPPMAPVAPPRRTAPALPPELTPLAEKHNPQAESAGDTPEG